MVVGHRVGNSVAFATVGGMKFADGPETAASLIIDADAEAIWPVVIDPATSPKFSDELQRAEWDEHPTGEPGLGSVLVGYNQRDDMGEWMTRSTITRFEPHRCFEWTVNDIENPVSVWRFDLAEVADGCQLSYRVRLGPGPSGLTEAIASMPEIEEQVIEGRLMMLHRNMVNVLEGIRDIVASSEPAD